MYEVRSLTAEDSESLATMLETAGYPHWAKDYRAWVAPTSTLGYNPAVHGPCQLVAIKDHTVIGMLEGRGPRNSTDTPWGSHVPGPQAMISRLATAIDHRGQGIATALMGAYRQWVRKRGGRSIVAWVADGDTADAIETRRAFFAAFGMVRLPDPDRYMMGTELDDDPAT